MAGQPRDGPLLRQALVFQRPVLGFCARREKRVVMSNPLPAVRRSYIFGGAALQEVILMAISFLSVALVGLAFLHGRKA